MKIRLYPRVRLLISNKKSKVKWGEFQKVSLAYLKRHFNNYWPTLKLKKQKGNFQIEVDQWFYNRYMCCYDHTILIEDKWKSGFDKNYKLIYEKLI